MSKARGWHEWLFHLRLAQARPELALARGERSTAITRATSAIHQSRTVARGKYEAAALTVRALALHARGRTHEALGDANLACAGATGRRSCPEGQNFCLFNVHRWR